MGASSLVAGDLKSQGEQSLPWLNPLLIYLFLYLSPPVRVLKKLLELGTPYRNDPTQNVLRDDSSAWKSVTCQILVLWTL